MMMFQHIDVFFSLGDVQMTFGIYHLLFHLKVLLPFSFFPPNFGFSELVCLLLFNLNSCILKNS